MQSIIQKDFSHPDYEKGIEQQEVREVFEYR